MLNKTLLLLLGLLIISPIYAFEFDNVLRTKQSVYTDYPILEIKNAYGFGETIAEIEIIENTDQCLIDCYTIGTIKLNSDNVLFSNLEFIDRINNVKYLDYNVYIEIEDKKEILTDTYNNVCGFDGNTTSCNQVKNGTVIRELIFKDWQKYKGQVLNAGSYRWKIESKKDDHKIPVDWSFSYLGINSEEIRNYYVWWSGNWSKKKAINITERSGNFISNYSVLINVTYDNDMNTTFSDLRFLDSNEEVEIPYYIKTIYPSNSALVWVNIPNVSASGSKIIYMYYGNSLAPSTSNENATFIYYDDFTVDRGLVNCTGFTTCTYSQSYLVLRFATGGSHYKTAGLFIGKHPNVSVEMLINTSLQYSHGISLRKTTTSSSDDSNQYIGGNTYAAADQLGIMEFDGGGTASTLVLNNHDYNVNNKFIDRFSASGSILNFSFLNPDGTYRAGNQTTDTTLTNGYVGIQIFEWNQDHLVDYIIIRNFTTPEPNYSIGIEQQEIITPVIRLNSPINYFNTTNNFTIFNCSAEIDNTVKIYNISFYFNDILNVTIVDNTDNFTEFYLNMPNLAEGLYNWSCKSSSNESIMASSPTRYLRVHFTSPSISIISPSGLIDTLTNGSNLTLNWTISEQGQDINVHIINCSYIYNGVTVYLTKNNCIVTNFSIFSYIDGIDIINMSVLDDIGLIGRNYTRWGYKTKFNGYTYNNITTEGNYENFKINITLNSSLQVSTGYINYNNTNHLGSFSRVGNEVIGSTNIVVDNVDIVKNLTFFWNLTFNDGSSISYPLANQTVLNLSIDDCSNFNVVILNFTIYEEESQTVLDENNDTSLEIAINITDQIGSTTILNFSGYKNKSSFVVCLSNNLTNSSSYRLNALAKYSSEFYATEYYNIVNATLNVNNSNMNISLYDLNLNESTEFQLTFTGSDFVTVENALVYVYRQYVKEDTFKVVELPKTDSNGQTVLHLVRNNVIYNIIIIKDGVVLGTFENLIVFCQDYTIGDCRIELNAFQSTTEIFNYNTNLGITYTDPEINITSGLISFDFNTVDGTSKNVTMNLIRKDFRGNNTICSTSMISTGGTLQCYYDPNSENTTIYLVIYVDGEQIYFSTIDVDRTNLGQMGYLFLFVMMLSLVLMLSNSKTGVLLAVLLGFMAGVGLGVTNDSIIGKGSSGLWLVVVIVIAIYKLNKKRES